MSFLVSFQIFKRTQISYLSYSFQISQQTYFNRLNIFIACIQNRAVLEIVSTWTLSKSRHFTFYILGFLVLHFWLPVLSNHWWIFEKKVLRISFSFSLLNSFSLFLSSVFCWQIPPCAPPDFLHNGVMLRVKGGLRERGRGGGGDVSGLQKMKVPLSATTSASQFFTCQPPSLPATS